MTHAGFRGVALTMKKYLAAFFIISSTNALADFCPCPSSFNLIQLGDSLQQIQATCCKPVSQKKYKLEPTVPQKWVYYISAPPTPSNTAQGSVEMTVVFDEKGKVTNISVNAQSLTSTNCGNTPNSYFGANMPNTIQVQVDTLESVKKACGPAKFETKGTPSEDTQTSEIVELQYAGPPPTTLKFQDNKLIEIIR
jgi:hypothetical protein